MGILRRQLDLKQEEHPTLAVHDLEIVSNDVR
jgi:hypothetical protein